MEHVAASGQSSVEPAQDHVEGFAAALLEHHQVTASVDALLAKLHVVDLAAGLA